MARRSDAVQALAVGMQTAQMNADIFRRMIRDILADTQGTRQEEKTTLRKLSEAAGGRLDHVPVTEDNIGIFEGTARKYNLSYALKRDPTETPPIYYVFFKANAGSKDTMEAALKEFAQQREKAALRREDLRKVEKRPAPDREAAAPDHKPKEKAVEDPDR